MKRLLPLFLLFLGLAQPAHAQFSRIISIQLENNDNSVAQAFQGPFALKAGASCTWSVSGTTATFNCSGGSSGISIMANQLAGGSGTNTIGAVGVWIFSDSNLLCFNDDTCGVAVTNTMGLSTVLVPGSLELSALTLPNVADKEFSLNTAGVMSGTASNTDSNGTITNSGGTGTYSFTRTFTSAPICIVQDDTTIAALLSKSVSTTALTVTTSGMTDTVSYVCIGRD